MDDFEKKKRNLSRLIHKTGNLHTAKDNSIIFKAMSPIFSQVYFNYSKNILVRKDEEGKEKNCTFLFMDPV